MKNDYFIRTAKKSDLIEVYSILFIASKEGFVKKRGKKEIENLIRKRNLFVAIILEENKEKIVGCAALDFYSKRLSELRSVYVKEGYRRIGIGNELIKNVFLKSKKLKIKELLLVTNKERKEVFKSFGFFEEAHGFKIALFKEIKK